MKGDFIVVFNWGASGVPIQKSSCSLKVKILSKAEPHQGSIIKQCFLLILMTWCAGHTPKLFHIYYFIVRHTQASLCPSHFSIPYPSLSEVQITWVTTKAWNNLIPLRFLCSWDREGGSCFSYRCNKVYDKSNLRKEELIWAWVWGYGPSSWTSWQQKCWSCCIHSQEEWVPWIGLLGSSSFHLVRDPGLWNGAASVLTPIYLIQKIIPETYPGVNSIVMPSPMELTIKGNHLTKQPHPLGHKSKITLQERGRRGVEGQKQPRLRIYRNATRHATLC